MTVAELIKKLKGMPQDYVVSYGGYEGDYASDARLQEPFGNIPGQVVIA